MSNHKRQFYEREALILATAEEMLLESVVGDFTLDELACSLDIAKGTLYKHFDSKDELFLHILIRYEKTLFEQNMIEDSPACILVRMLLQILYRPRRAMLFNHLEETLADSRGLNRLFDELYSIRRQRMDRLLVAAKLYLSEQNSTMTTRDYLSAIWAIGQGGASLLNSTFYQRFLGRRDTLILSLIDQVLNLPSLYVNQTASPAQKMDLPPKATANAYTHSKPSVYADFSPFGKMTPPVL